MRKEDCNHGHRDSNTKTRFVLIKSKDPSESLVQGSYALGNSRWKPQKDASYLNTLSK